MINNELKNDVQEIKRRIDKSGQYIDYLLLSNTASAYQLNENMDDLLAEMENGCIIARTILEKHRPLIPDKKDSGKLKLFNDITGSVELTPEMWVHIKSQIYL